MAFPITALDAVVELAIGANLAADPSTWSWTDVTVREKPKISITRGRRNRVGDIAPTRVQATADNADGNLCRHNPLGTHFGTLKKNTPMRVRVNNGSGYVSRAAVFVPGFPPSWDPTGADQTVTLTGVGLMDRLGRGRVLRSPLFRTMSGQLAGDLVPVCYVPMEDGSGATSLASGIAGGRGANFSSTGVSLASNSNCAGSKSLPVLSQYGRITGTIPPFVLTEAWFGQFAFKYDTPPPSNRTLAYIQVPGAGSGVTELRVILDVTTLPGQSGILVRALDANGATVGEANSSYSGIVTWPTDADFYSQYYSIMFGMWATSAVPGSYDIFVQMSGVNHQITTVGTNTISGNAARPTSYIFGHNTAETWSIGHLGFFATNEDAPGSTFTSQANQHAQAVPGYAGEQAHERAERLCGEEGVPFTSSATRSQAMGPQPSDTRLIDLLRECANTDSGLLYEDMDFGLTFVSSSQRYNQTAAVTLDYGASQVGIPWEPEDDSQDYFNDVTASRPDGSSYRTADQDEIDELGAYVTGIDPNVETDDQLEHVAGWRLNLGLNDELTWPDVRPNVVLGGALLNSWLAVDLGDILAVTNHPAPLAPGTIRQVIEGYTETLGSFTYSVSAILSPASPWDVAVYDTAKYDSATTESIKAITSGVTSLDVACGDGVAWTTSGAQYPYDLNVAGEQVTATACSNLTLTARTVGTAAHGNNAAVTPGLPAGLAEADVLMVLAAIRNSGTGTVDDEPSYETLVEFGNVKLQAKYAPSGAAAPQITFTGGVAAADTSAQMMAFAGCGLQVHNYATQLNASAQNIAYPALEVNRDNCLILYLGWKQDNWTSVTGPGTEIGEPSTASGDDQGLVWAYQLQTAATDIAAGSFVVTGGASAISRGMVVALTTQAQRFTLTRAVNGVVKAHAAGTPVRLWNTPRYAL